jgi:hypothetical protein
MRLSQRIRKILSAAARRAASRRRSKIARRREYLVTYCALRYVALKGRGNASTYGLRGSGR